MDVWLQEGQQKRILSRKATAVLKHWCQPDFSNLIDELRAEKPEALTQILDYRDRSKLARLVDATSKQIKGIHSKKASKIRHIALDQLQS